MVGWPTFLPAPMKFNFVVALDPVSNEESRLLLPLNIYRNPDMQHMGKNAEKAGTQNGFGSGVSLGEGADGDLKKDFVKSALMRLARLMGKDAEFTEIVRSEVKQLDRHLAKIPGEVNHRLKILTTLATMALDFRAEFLSAFEKYNEAYGSGSWKTNEKILVEMVHEVYKELHDPRLMMFFGVLRKLHPIAEYIYTVFQASVYVLFAIMFAFILLLPYYWCYACIESLNALN